MGRATDDEEGSEETVEPKSESEPERIVRSNVP